MDPCPFVRILVGNLALKIPVASRPALGGVHPSSSPCFCKLRLNNLPPQTAAVTLDPAADPQALTLAATFNLTAHDLGKASTPRSKLKVSIYTGRRGSTCGINSGRLLGKVTVPLDLTGAESKGCVFHNGWVEIGKENKGKSSSSTAVLHLTVRSEPDPRFVMEFDGEVECSPQVFQVKGRMRQPVFTCKFGTSRPADHHLRTRSLPSEPTTSRSSWLSTFNSDRERPLKERKGWHVTIHDLSGSTVAMASITTPFVASPSGSNRVTSSNPGAWLILRRGESSSMLKPWARLEAWRHRSGAGSHDALGYRLDLLPDPTTNPNSSPLPLAESNISTSKGGKFTIDLVGNSTLLNPRVSGDFGYCLWPFTKYRGFVMSATVEGEGKCSKPVVEIGVQHVGCMEDAAAFVAVAAAIDLSMDACKLFSHKLRKELSLPRNL